MEGLGGVFRGGVGRFCVGLAVLRGRERGLGEEMTRGG